MIRTARLARAFAFAVVTLRAVNRHRSDRHADPQRQAVFRDARPQRLRLHEPVQRHVLRREDGRHRDHPARRANRDRRRRAPHPDARAVGSDPEARRSQGRSGDEHDHLHDALRGVRLRLAPRRHSGRRGVQGHGVRRQASAGRARRPRRAESRVRAGTLLGAHVSDRRQARHLPALSSGPDDVAAGREEDPAVRGVLDVRPARTSRLHRGAAADVGNDAGDGARGSRAPRRDPRACRAICSSSTDAT